MCKYGLQPGANRAETVQNLQNKFDEDFEKLRAARDEYIEKKQPQRKTLYLFEACDTRTSTRFDPIRRPPLPPCSSRSLGGPLPTIQLWPLGFKSRHGPYHEAVSANVKTPWPLLC